MDVFETMVDERPALMVYAQKLLDRDMRVESEFRACDHADFDGCLPIHYACIHGNDLLLKALLAIMNSEKVDAVNNGGWTALSLAVYHGHMECIHILLQAKATPLQSPNPWPEPQHPEADQIFDSLRKLKDYEVFREEWMNAYQAYRKKQVWRSRAARHGSVIRDKIRNNSLGRVGMDKTGIESAEYKAIRAIEKRMRARGLSPSFYQRSESAKVYTGKEKHKNQWKTSTWMMSQLFYTSVQPTKSGSSYVRNEDEHEANAAGDSKEGYEAPDGHPDEVDDRKWQMSVERFDSEPEEESVIGAVEHFKSTLKGATAVDAEESAEKMWEVFKLRM